ncbi:hypothetical protein SALBM311S_00244 [Streptomyces alboniger]
MPGRRAHSLAGDLERVARLLGTAAATGEGAGTPHPAAEQGDVERISARVRATIDEGIYAREFALGTLSGHET